jgi:hypothetical protein
VKECGTLDVAFAIQKGGAGAFEIGQRLGIGDRASDTRIEPPVWTAPPTQVESLKDKQARVGRVQTCVRPRYAGLAGGPVWSSKVRSKTPGRARRHGRFTWFFRPRLTTVAPYLSSKTLPTPFPAFLRVGYAAALEA